MTTNLNVLQVIPKLGYGGAETGCYDIAHFLPENDCGSFVATSGGEVLKFVKKDKVMQKANEKIKTNLLIEIKSFTSRLEFPKKKICFKLIMKIGENAKKTPNKKPTLFLNTVIKFFSLSNRSPKWKEKEAKSFPKFHNKTGV